MTIDWDELDEHDDPVRAGALERGLSTWLCRAVESDDEASRGTEFVASTGTVDRMDDVIEQQTWKLGPFRANNVILYEHHVPVVGAGKVKLFSREDAAKELRLKVKWDESSLNPLGMLAAHQHRNGFRHAVSVGFIPGEATSRKDLPDGDPLRVVDDNVSRWMAGYVFRHCELLEVSTVGVPANREALQLSLYAGETDDPHERVQRHVRGSVERRVADLVLEALKSDPAIEKALVTRVFGSKAEPPRRPAPPLPSLRWFPESS